MSYQALYRTWRPQTFQEVVGQNQTVTALHNAVTAGKLSHAYLFSGPRGTGKTSVAKIVAKAANCSNLIEGEPCNCCSACIDINNNSFMDVVEIDAASNRGIDEIRDLREKVRMLPAQGKMKVYIIDEVHMLTAEAFNALLKTLEEPPGSVIFVLATTELQKIPATIRSRCQNYAFRRLTMTELTERLRQISLANSIDIDPEAIQLIARRANGGLRDALSTLDQIYSYRGHSINKQDVLDVMGLVDDVFLAQLVDAVMTSNLSSLMELISLSFEQGKEPLYLVREAILYFRDILLYKTVGENVDFAVVTMHSLTYIQQQYKQITTELLVQTIKTLQDAAEKLRFSESQRFLLELVFLEIAGHFDNSRSKITAAKANMNKAQTHSNSNVNNSETGNEAKDELWQKILAGVKSRKIPTHALLMQGKLLGVKDNAVYIGYRKGYKFHKEKMEEKGNLGILQEVLEEITGKPCEIQFVFLDDDQYNNIVVKKAIEIFGPDIVDIK